MEKGTFFLFSVHQRGNDKASILSPYSITLINAVWVIYEYTYMHELYIGQKIFKCFKLSYVRSKLYHLWQNNHQCQHTLPLKRIVYMFDIYWNTISPSLPQDITQKKQGK